MKVSYTHKGKYLTQEGGVQMIMSGLRRMSQSGAPLRISNIYIDDEDGDAGELQEYADLLGGTKVHNGSAVQNGKPMELIHNVPPMPYGTTPFEQTAAGMFDDDAAPLDLPSVFEGEDGDPAPYSYAMAAGPVANEDEDDDYLDHLYGDDQPFDMEEMLDVDPDPMDQFSHGPVVNDGDTLDIMTMNWDEPSQAAKKPKTREEQIDAEFDNPPSLFGSSS